MTEFLCVFLCIAGITSTKVPGEYVDSRFESTIQESDTFYTYVWSPVGLMLFSYRDSTKLKVLDSAGAQVWTGVLDADEYQQVATGVGVFQIVGYGEDNNHSILVGDPIIGTVHGWYAIDEHNRAVSEKFLTVLPEDWGGASLFVFAYEDNTSVEVRSLPEGTLIDEAVINKGENLTIPASTATVIKVTADKGVSVLSYGDQGYWIPASNATFAGTLFYTWVGFIGGWQNDLNIIAYYDETHVTVKNTETGTTIWEDDINEGESHIVMTQDRFITIESDKDISCLVAPFESFTDYYYRFYIGMEMLGEGLGVNFYHPTQDESALYIFSYRDDNWISAYNITQDRLDWRGRLDKGELHSFRTDNVLYHIVSEYDISVFDVLFLGEAAGVEFAPVMGPIRPGVMLSPDQEQAAKPGASVAYQVTVTNDGNRWDIVDIVADHTDAVNFFTEVYDSANAPLPDANDNDEDDTGVLPGSESITLKVMVFAQENAPIGTVDTCTVMGTSHQNTAVRDSVLLITHVTEAGVEEDVATPLTEFSCTVANDVLNVSFTGSGRDEYVVSLYDLTGRRVQSAAIRESRTSIDVFHLTPGVYFVSVKIGERSIVKKIVINR